MRGRSSPHGPDLLLDTAHKCALLWPDDRAAPQRQGWQVMSSMVRAWEQKEKAGRRSPALRRSAN